MWATIFYFLLNEVFYEDRLRRCEICIRIHSYHNLEWGLLWRPIETILLSHISSRHVGILEWGLLWRPIETLHQLFLGNYFFLNEVFYEDRLRLLPLFIMAILSFLNEVFYEDRLRHNFSWHKENCITWMRSSMKTDWDLLFYPNCLSPCLNEVFYEDRLRPLEKLEKKIKLKLEWGLLWRPIETLKSFVGKSSVLAWMRSSMKTDWDD